METKHTLHRKAGTQHLALRSDNHHAFSKWPNIMEIIGRHVIDAWIKTYLLAVCRQPFLPTRDQVLTRPLLTVDQDDHRAFYRRGRR